MKKIIFKKEEDTHINIINTIKPFGIIQIKNMNNPKSIFYNKKINVYNCLINITDVNFHSDINTSKYFYMVEEDVKQYDKNGTINGYYFDIKDCIINRKEKIKRLLEDEKDSI